METSCILVVDESPGLTQDLMLALRRRTEFQVLGPVPDAAAAMAALSAERVDLVLVHLDRCDDSGVAVVSAVMSTSPIPVMGATRNPVAPIVELALAAGACGVITEDRDTSSLVSAFQRALAGELVLPVDGLPMLVDRLRGGETRWVQVALLATLTRREREVLTALAQGVTTSGIALELGISPATVQTHVRNIFAKLGVHSQVEAVGTAWRAGLVFGPRSAWPVAPFARAAESSTREPGVVPGRWLRTAVAASRQ